MFSARKGAKEMLSGSGLYKKPDTADGRKGCSSVSIMRTMLWDSGGDG